MSFSNELIMTITAASMGFTVATGINFSYFQTINNDIAQQEVNHITVRIPEFWHLYTKIDQVQEVAIDKPHEGKLCVTISDDEVCVPKVE